jgi:hypothetical protein
MSRLRARQDGGQRRLTDIWRKLKKQVRRGVGALLDGVVRDHLERFCAQSASLRGGEGQPRFERGEGDGAPGLAYDREPAPDYDDRCCGASGPAVYAGEGARVGTGRIALVFLPRVAGAC